MKTTSSKTKKTVPTTAKKPAAKTTVAAPARAIATVKKSAKAAPAKRSEITSESIASRAYSLWEQQGRPHGKDLELWLQAEKQLKSSQSFAA